MAVIRRGGPSGRGSRGDGLARAWTSWRPGDAPLGGCAGPVVAARRAADLDPELRPALLALVEPDERGDPMSPLRWTCKSTRQLAGELTGAGAPGQSADTVADLLREAGLQPAGQRQDARGQASTPTATPSSATSTSRSRRSRPPGQPVISVDTKKKELVGDFKNGGREWQPAGRAGAGQTSTTSPTAELGKAIPYGVYDLAANTGWVSVGIDHDTAAFAVERSAAGGSSQGRHAYPRRRRGC